MQKNVLRQGLTCQRGFPGGASGKESCLKRKKKRILSANAGDMRSIPGLRRSLGGGHSNPLQHFCLENPRGAWWATVHAVTELDMTVQLST